MGNLGEFYVTLGHLELSRDLMQKMADAAIESFGEFSNERGRALNSLGAVLELNGEQEFDDMISI